jgi:hypothetical protein
MPERVGDQATMEPPKFERCSILLTFQKLMISDSNRTTELWTKQPRRDGGTRVGAIWGSAEGAALQRFGCERITPSWDALSSFAHFPNLPQVFTLLPGSNPDFLHLARISKTWMRLLR